MFNITCGAVTSPAGWLCRSTFTRFAVSLLLLTQAGHETHAMALSTAESDTLDLTTGQSVPLNRHWVMFSARGRSLTGHAYVIWGREDPEQLQTTMLCYGLYPDEGNLKRVVLGPVTGRFSDSDCWEATAGEISLITEVDPEVYDKSLDVYRRWDKDLVSDTRQYHLLYSNCVLFVREVAQSIGLRTPSGLFSFPQHFISALLIQNTGRRRSRTL